MIAMEQTYQDMAEKELENLRDEVGRPEIEKTQIKIQTRWNSMEESLGYPVDYTPRNANSAERYGESPNNEEALEEFDIDQDTIGIFNP